MNKEGLTIAFWFTDLLLLSTVLALFEILLERDKGWASGLDEAFWGRHVLKGTLFVQLLEKSYLTVYHLVMFVGVVPLIFLIEYAFLRRFNLGLLPSAPAAALCVLCSVWFGLAVVEDFLWFVMNWYYPGSLRDLFSGRIWWHTRWVRIGSRKIPRFYITSLVMSLALLGLGLRIH